MTTTNNFEYERVSYLGSSYIKWKLVYNGYVIKGEASTVRQAFRRAKRSLKRYKKLEKELNN